MLAGDEHHYGIADGLLYDEVTDPDRHSKQTRYDANGNMTSRNGAMLTYDAEDRLASYSGGGTTASFVYDGDGKRVKATFNGTTTVYMGGYYEKTGSNETQNAE